jgi:SAM-dependent methyltransferase
MKAWAYDLMYRSWAPWDAVGVRSELRDLVESRRISAASHPRALDLGCGTGANVVYLAQQGFDSTGVDFSHVALAKARARAAKADVSCRFVHGDLTASTIDGVDGPFDFVLDFGTLDDLGPEGRRAMASTVRRLTAPGSVFLFWCFFADPAALPRFSFTGPSRAVPVVRPGEERELFGADFDIEPLARTARTASFLLTRR